MKKYLFPVLFLFGAHILFSQTEATIKVKVNNIEFQKGGDLKIALFDCSESFKKKDNPVQSMAIAVTQKTTECIFQNVPAGIYAIALYHDKNLNNKLDKSFIGLPKEAYGFSNNAKGTFGSPTFQATSFAIDGSPVSLYIEMIN